MRCATADARANHSVETAPPLQLPDADLPVDPYVLGVWLGDGHTASARFTSADPEIVMEIEGRGYWCTSLRVRLGRARLYPIALPTEPRRHAPVRGLRDAFVPRLPQVRTCGQSCGGKVRTLSGRGPGADVHRLRRRTTGQLRCAECHAAYGSVQGRLRTLGVLGNKHIPALLSASERVAAT